MTYYVFERMWEVTRAWSTMSQKGRNGAGAFFGSAGGGYLADRTDALSPLTVWTQIRSIIKGSQEAAFGDSERARLAGSPICREEYLELPNSRVNLDR